MIKILLLGSSGFVGKNINEIISKTFSVIKTQRLDIKNDKIVYLDLEDKNTWQNLLPLKFDIVINSIGYGVVKNEINCDKFININYILPMELREYLINYFPNLFWIQIGTAFEYSLDCERIDESSQTNPQTLYGISKLMFSNYLLKSSNRNFLILRPFAMFGKYEENSKIIPTLIYSQILKERVKLSSGLQERDYLYVDDFVNFLLEIIVNNVNKLSGEIINVGSGHPLELFKIAQILSNQIEEFNELFWEWGKLTQRDGEAKKFYNYSTKCFDLGLEITPLDEALKFTVNHFRKKLNYGVKKY